MSCEVIKNGLNRCLSILLNTLLTAKHDSISKKIQKEAQTAGFKLASGAIDAPITDKSIDNLFFFTSLPGINNNVYHS